jgi:hypothetical protein
MGWWANAVFTFTATGGTGPYDWLEMQTYVVNGYISQNNGQSTVTTIDFEYAVDAPLASAPPSTLGAPATVRYYDSPGINTTNPDGTVTSAYLVWNFTLNVQVSDASGQWSSCTLNWWAAVSVNPNPAGGIPIGSGGSGLGSAPNGR